MARLIWSRRALKDLDDACEYIARDSLKYAHVFAEGVVTTIETIPRHPLLGAIVPEYNREDLRERLFQNYRIVYRVRKDRIEIAAIIHGARLMPSSPPE